MTRLYAGPDMKALLLLALIAAPSALATPLAEALPEAEADALPEPQADPQAEADPQYYGMPRQPAPPMGIRPPFGPPSPCQMTNQCCGMANQQCCVGGQRCYTVYERECDTTEVPQCQVGVDQICVKQESPQCRQESSVETRQLQASHCKPKPLTKCFPYQRKQCVPTQRTVQTRFDWINDKLVPGDRQTVVKCQDIITFNCTDRVIPKTRTRQVPKTKLVPREREVCRMVTIPGQSYTRNITTWVTTFEQACYDMPVPQCSTASCQTGLCGSGASVCSRNNFQTSTVCPLTAGRGAVAINAAMGGSTGVQPVTTEGMPGNVIGGGSIGMGVPGGSGMIGASPCQQIRQPVCMGGMGGGSCNTANQQCCTQGTRRVCRQVPRRIPRVFTQVQPGRPTYKRECSTVPYNDTTTEWVTEDVPYNVTTQDCAEVKQNKCVNITIPSYTVKQEPEFQNAGVQVPYCNVRTVQDTYCHTFPSGEMECTNTTISRQFRINKIVCDKIMEQPFCTSIPSLNCTKGMGQTCRMVPRQVCQPGCSDSAQCRQCSAFVQGNGFGSCPSNTCGNFVVNPGVPVMPPPQSGIESIGPGGSNSYPGFGGGSVGGSNSFPGQGGGVFIPGGSNEYPGVGGGVVGGDSSYPGADYPGMGGGYPSGPIGGSSNYPGADYPIGGGNVYPGGSVGGSSSFNPGYPGSNYPMGGGYPGGVVGGSSNYPGGLSPFAAANEETVDDANDDLTSIMSEDPSQNEISN